MVSSKKRFWVQVTSAWMIIAVCATGLAGEVDTAPMNKRQEELLFSGRFEDMPISLEEWREAWGIPWMSRGEQVKMLSTLDGKQILWVTYPEGGVGPGESGLQFPVRLTHLKDSPQENQESLLFRYQVKFAPGFDFRLGGKLPGFTDFTMSTHVTEPRNPKE